MTFLITENLMDPLNEHDREKKREQDHGSTSHSLIDRLQNNDAPAWSDLVYLYSPLITYWARRAGLPEKECADVLQEVFRAVVSGIHQFKKQKKQDTFRGWLRTITRFKVADYFRSNHEGAEAVGGTEANLRLNATSDDDDELAGDTDALIAEHEHLKRALNMIRADFKENTWKAFWAVVVENKSDLRCCAAIEHDNWRCARGEISSHETPSRSIRRIPKLNNFTLFSKKSCAPTTRTKNQ